MKKLKLFSLALMALFATSVWADYYTPTADEVIRLQADAYKSDGTNYSKHSAIAWEGNPSWNDATAGDPDNNGAATSSNVKCCSVKGNGGAKNLTISITGCSKIIIYHQTHSSRYVELRDGSKSGTLIGKGVANTYYTEVSLSKSTNYDIFLHGTSGTDDTDLNVYAVKLIKAPDCDDPEATFSVAKTLADINEEVALTFTSKNTNAVSYTIKKGGAVTADATITDGKFKATVAGTYEVTASQAADAPYCEVSETKTIKVASLLTGWVVFDGLVDEALRTSPITNDAVSMSYEAASTSIVDAGSKNLVGTTRAYSKLMQIAKSTGGYLKFTVPSGYTATFTHAFSGTGNRTIILASAKINSTSSEGYIATLCSANSGDIKWGEYTTPLAAGDYYICDCNNGNWQIAELVFDLQSTTFAPSFTSPASEPETVYYEQNQAATALSVTATGAPAPALQWYSNTTKSTEGAEPIENEENATYTPSTATAGDFYYYCVATNASGTATSYFFHINVAEAICPTGLTISGESEYSERTDIELTAKEAGSIGTGTTYSKASCAKSDKGNYFCVATKANCSEAASEPFEITITDYVCPTSGLLYSLTMKNGLSTYQLPAYTDLQLSPDYATIVNGSATLSKINTSSAGKAQIYNSEAFFNSNDDSYLKVEMYCKLEPGDSIICTSSVNRQLWLTNTNSASNHIETADKKYVVVEDDILDGKSVFYIYRKSGGGASVKTIKVSRPKGSATAISEVEESASAVKRIVNGQLFIEKNGHVYNVFGACIK